MNKKIIYDRLYVIVRNDLTSMTPGKAEAHSGHAASALILRHVVHAKRDKHSQSFKKRILAWDHKKLGFGTQINLSGTINDMLAIDEWLEDCAMDEHVSGWVIDPTYPFSDGVYRATREETTAYYLFGGERILPAVQFLKLK